MTEQINIPEWKSYSTHKELSEQLREALRDVKDPEIGTDIIQLGLIRDVAINSEDAVVTMILTTPYCPYGPSMMESARKIAEETIKKKTTVVYGDEVWDQSMMEDPTSFNWGLF